MTALAVYFAASLAMALALTPICRLVAHRSGLVAAPKADRWHQQPTALFGGVAIAVPTLLVAATIRPLGDIWQFMACGAAIACFGFLDDFYTMKPSTKLIVQIALASALLFFGYRLHWTSSLIIDTMLSVFWIVGITNAFNLLDNMDGLCAGTAIVAGTFLLIPLLREGAATPTALYIVALLGATAGFLVYNFNPASIFMGDTGSLFLGLNLAALTLMTQPQGGPGRAGLLSVMAVPVLLLLIPIFDTTLVTAIRLLSGRKPSQGGRDHTSHRLVAIGLSPRAAVAVLWLLAAAGGGIGLSFRVFDASWGVTMALGFLLAMIIFAVYLARVRVYEDTDFAKLREGSITPVIVDFMYKRRVAEVLLDACLVPLAYYTAYRLRFEGALLTDNYQYFLQSLPVVLATQVLAIFLVGGYRGAWRHFGMMDAVVFAKGVLVGTLGAQLAILYMYRFENYSRAVFVIYAAMLLLMLAASRASFRLLSEFVQRRRNEGERCVVYGTAGASLATIREAFGDSVPLRIVGFVDDDPQQRRLRVGGYHVLGGYERLLTMIDANELDCVLLNTRIIDVDRLRRLELACQQRDINLLRLRIDVKPTSAAS